MSAYVLSQGASVSSFGAEQTTFGNGFSGRGILEGPRYQELDRKQSYYDCTQHDRKFYNFDGRTISTTGKGGVTAPYLTQEKAPFMVPLDQRRPSNPYRLARGIVRAFTNMTFGSGRFPRIRCPSDSRTQDFVTQIVKDTKLRSKMVRARNLGGAMGTVALTWGYYQGAPVINVVNAKNLYVHAWEDRDNLIPKHVSQVYIYVEEGWNPQKRRREMFPYWYRRDWAPDWDIVFERCHVEEGKDPFWRPDLTKSVQHNDGICHLTWIQNLPSEEIDGECDYESMFEPLDGLDMLNSAVQRACVNTLDPTLKLKMDMAALRVATVRRGSDNAIVTGKDGDASYLEISGEGIKVGLEVFAGSRRSILEAVSCILPDPSEIAAQGVSSLSLKAIFGPMIGQCETYEEQYGEGIDRVLRHLVTIAQRASQSQWIVFDDEGKEQPAKLELSLSPKVVKTPVVGDDGEPTGESKVTLESVEPGLGNHFDYQWGPYFQVTAQERQQEAQTLTAATGGRPFLSQKSAAEVAARSFELDPEEEVRRIQLETSVQESKEASLLDVHSAIGGAVNDRGGLPPGALPRKSTGFSGLPALPNPKTEDDDGEPDSE